MDARTRQIVPTFNPRAASNGSLIAMHRLFLPDGQITFPSGIGISNASKIFRLIARPFACGVELGSGFRIETKIDRIHQNVGDISQKRLDFLFIF